MPLEQLLPATEKWLGHLPPDVFPRALVTHFPRIINLIALQWDNYNSCQAYFQELLVDRRPERQGFPAAVVCELEKLRDHWYSGRGR